MTIMMMMMISHYLFNTFQPTALCQWAKNNNKDNDDEIFCLVH